MAEIRNDTVKLSDRRSAACTAALNLRRKLAAAQVHRVTLRGHAGEPRLQVLRG
ncbi:MAG TPA: hypothetical protein VLI21_15285 [Casimicrobiaceae bacterium]|nr:hypothetical protein [Casimicrobiaceae bacterium]